MAANGYAVWATMVTTSIIVGLAAAPLWTAQCSYFTLVAGRWGDVIPLALICDVRHTSAPVHDVTIQVFYVVIHVLPCYDL